MVKRDGAEQVGEPTAARVGDDAGRHFEQHQTGGEERVGRKRLRIAQPRVEQEQRVDAPDERSGQRVQQQQGYGRSPNRTWWERRQRPRPRYHDVPFDPAGGRRRNPARQPNPVR